MTPGAEPAPGFSWPEALCAPVRALPSSARLWVALSGGLDSTLLLHLVAHCHRSVADLRAVHVNHQLQPNASETEAFCGNLCARLGVPLTVRPVDPSAVASRGHAGGLEEAAREARYGVFETLLESGDLLLMAHHADDQAETVLFRLLRGTGVAGLAGMPADRPLGAGRLIRPLLAFDRAELQHWAQAAGLSWIEDPSNTDEGFDRNFLRHRILPELRERWPGLNQRLFHSARACGESETLNRTLAALQWRDLGGESHRIPVSGLLALSVPEQKNLIRWWARECGFPVPSPGDWRQVLNDLLRAGADREPLFQADGFSLRRFRGWLYLVPDAPALPSEPRMLNAEGVVHWGEWRIRLMPVGKPSVAAPAIRISTRQGGERVRFRPGTASRPVKKWLQEQAVPPWERARLPLVFAGAGDAPELVAIGDLWCSEQYSEGAHAAGWRLVVEREFD
ncbi:MAG: tRNA lysidine(34) synthetase TilS [Pseudomonadota bacterium]|nr:tRNA lysidine(34) synthetase TilS [Pseudomonadota bacterium]